MGRRISARVDETLGMMQALHRRFGAVLEMEGLRRRATLGDPRGSVLQDELEAVQ